MRDAATLLRKLVDAGEGALVRPAIGSESDLVALLAELREAAPFAPDPAGGLLIEEEALLLGQAIARAAHHRACGDAARAMLMRQVAGVLLPAVHAAHWRAIEVRRDARPTP